MIAGAPAYHPKWLFPGFILIIMTALSVFITLNFTLQSPYILVGLAMAGVYAALVFRNPEILLATYFTATVLNFNNVEGFYIWGALFYAISLIILVLWVLPWFFLGKIKLENKIDQVYLLFMIFIAFGVINGIFHSGSIARPISEIAYFSAIFGYFLYRDYFDSEKFRKVIFWLMMIIIFYVLIRNFLNYRALLLAAVMEWETQAARAHRNEVILLWGSVLFLVFSVYQKSLIKTALLAIPMMLFVGGLILTQSRGYWIAFAFAALVFFVISNNQAKIKMVVAGSIALIAGLTLAALFFGGLFDTISTALVERISSIGSGKLDVSLRERILETQTVFEKTIKNPILGYGLGTTYDKFFIVPAFKHQTIATSYVHNGYLAIWYKFGLAGLITILTFCFYILKYSFYVAKRTDNYNVRMILLAMFSALCGMLVVNITSPQFITFDCLFLIFMMAAYTSYHYSELIKKHEV